MGDDITEMSTKNESLKTMMGSYVEKWWKESRSKLLKQFVDEKRVNIIVTNGKTDEKTINKNCHK